MPQQLENDGPTPLLYPLPHVPPAPTEKQDIAITSSAWATGNPRLVLQGDQTRTTEIGVEKNLKIICFNPLLQENVLIRWAMPPKRCG